MVKPLANCSCVAHGSRSYLDIESDAFTQDGWLKTGDVGHIDPQGYVQLTDRSKDVIKSGGEWIVGRS